MPWWVRMLHLELSWSVSRTLHKVLQNCLERSRQCWVVHKHRREGCLLTRKAWESHQCSRAQKKTSTCGPTRSRTTCRVWLQEKRINDNWNGDGSRTFRLWTGFTKFTLLNEKPPPGFMWSGRGLTNIQATRRDHFWPEIWIGMSQNRKERMGFRETKARKRSKIERDLFRWSGRWRVLKPSKMKEVRSSNESCFVL